MSNEHFRDRWNPYTERDYAVHMLDDSVFSALQRGEYIEAELFCYGCLDAPDDIPLGGTSCIKTVGGWYREEYLRLDREIESWADMERAKSELAAEIQKWMKDW